MKHKCALQPLNVLPQVIQATVTYLHPSIIEDVVHRVGMQLGRQMAAEYRQVHHVIGRFDGHACARCRETIGKQRGWKPRVRVESDDVIHIEVVDCPRGTTGEPDYYACDLISAFFGGVVGARVIDQTKAT